MGLHRVRIIDGALGRKPFVGEHFMSRRFLCSLFIILLFAMSAPASAPDYRVINVFKVGGDGGWDHLTADPSARRIYISRSTRVMVVDADSGKPIGEITDTPGVHGIALAPELGRGFTSNGGDGTVTIFDIKSLITAGKVEVGKNPDAILFDPATRRVFTFNNGSRDSTVIDAAEGTVLGTIKLGGSPRVAASDGKGEIFVNIEDSSELVAIDSNEMKVKARWPLAPCQSPYGLAMDHRNRRLFVGCENQMIAVVNADSGKVVSTLAIRPGVDAVTYDDETGLAFATCFKGFLNVIRENSPNQFSVAESIPTLLGARTLALDAKTHNVFVVTAQYGPLLPPSDKVEHYRRSLIPDSFVVLVVGK